MVPIEARPATGRASVGEVVLKALGWGVGAGGLGGLIVGSIVYPVLGTAAGTAVGLVLGAVFGLVNGLVLAVVLRLTRSPGCLGLVAGAVSTGCGLLVFRVAAAGGGLDVRPALSWLAVALCGLAGVVLGPQLARSGLDPSGSCSAAGVPTWQRVVRYGSRGALAGCCVGGAVGFVVGLLAYLPTSPFAAFEGAVFGAAPGVLGGLLAFAVRAAIRAHRPIRDH